MVADSDKPPRIDPEVRALTELFFAKEAGRVPKETFKEACDRVFLTKVGP